MIGQRIKEIRKDNHLTQKGFGKSLDLGPLQISRYERGEQSPSVKVIEQISLKYNVTIDWLVRGPREKYSDSGETVELEEQLLEQYRLLAEGDQELVKQIISLIRQNR